MKKITWKIIFFFWGKLWIYQRVHKYLVLIFKKKNEIKVFCIGYPKTGSTSLYKALNILGYRTIRLFDGTTWFKRGREKYISNIKKSKYDAFVDFPIGVDVLYQEIDKEIPNSKFILTIRDKESLEKSYKNYYKNAPFEDAVNKYFQSKLLVGLNERNEQVIEYFKNKPSQLLVMNIINGDGWKKLCNFLNKPIPNKSFPHKNKGKYKNNI